MKSHIAPDVPYALYIWPYITGIKSTGGAFDPPTQQTINVYFTHVGIYMEGVRTQITISSVDR